LGNAAGYEGRFGLDKIKNAFIIYLLNQSIMMMGKVYPRNLPNKNGNGSQSLFE
jgi:hypothetical protein